MSPNHIRRWTAPAVAAAVVLAGGTAWAATEPSSQATPAAEVAVVVSAAPAKIVELTDDGDATVRCVQTDAADLAAYPDFVFQGMVTAVVLEDDPGLEPGGVSGAVTVAVTKVFKGAPADIAQIELRYKHSPDQMEVGSGMYEIGESFLIVSHEGHVGHCGGGTGRADDPQLQELYEAAF